MLDGYKLYDADAHVLMTPEMWATLPEQFALRRPRPVRIGDSADLRHWNTSWLLDGQLQPHPYGAGTHAANNPGMVLEEYGADPHQAGDFRAFPMSIGCATLASVPDRLEAMDKLGIDLQVLFPSTVYAQMSSDPFLEAALFRAYNRYVGKKCAENPKRLRWAGLVPMREPGSALEAIKELQALGAATVVLFGTVGYEMLSAERFTPVWDALAETGLPVCIHMAMSFPPLADLCQTIQDSNMIGKAMPAQLAFVAVFGHGLFTRYPKMKFAFLEFGGEWIFYSVGRMTHYVELNRARMPNPASLGTAAIGDLVKSGRFYLAVESSDTMMAQELALLGDGQILYSSDFPHGEGRDSAAAEVIARTDITHEQKEKVLYGNAAAFFGEP
jgi:predicted TIM-barrel fold metal-dependent hydrolase